MQPRFPVYIISKGRHESRVTSRYLEQMRVPYRIVVEEQERDAYAAVIDPAKILILDPDYQRDYDAFWPVADGASKGSGPARNFVWDHAISTGAPWHWIMDDNIHGFFRLNQNKKLKLTDGTCFACMEDFATRYKNVGMAGPNYHAFAVQTAHHKPFTLNTRLYSCILIRNDIPFRWRGRYNEDADLSIRVLKSGLCTVQFYAFLQHKDQTQTMKGGNMDAFYAAEGTLPKSRMLAEMHPDVTKVVWKFGRWHHHVDYRGFTQKLIRNPDVPVTAGVDNYGMRLIHLGETHRQTERATALRPD